MDSLTGSMDLVGLSPPRQDEPMETGGAAEKLQETQEQTLQAVDTGPASDDVGTGQKDPKLMVIPLTSPQHPRMTATWDPLAQATWDPRSL